MKLKEYLPLLIALAIPVILIVAMIFGATLPARRVKPQYNFLYTTGYYYGGPEDSSLRVRNHRLEKSQPSQSYDPYYRDIRPVPIATPDLYIYNVSTNTNRKVSFEEATQFYLDEGPASSDGYEVFQADQYGSDGFPFGIFGPSSDYGIYIRGNGGQKKITITNRPYGFRFIGWIVSSSES